MTSPAPRPGPAVPRPPVLAEDGEEVLARLDDSLAALAGKAPTDQVAGYARLLDDLAERLRGTEG